MCQWFKNRKTIYGRLQPNKTTELKSWDLVHVDLIRPYSKSTRQYKTGGAIIKNNVSLACMTMIYLAMGQFEMSEVPAYDLSKVKGGNDEYTEKSSVRVSQLLLKHGLAGTCIHAKFCLTTDLSLN